MWYAAYLIKQAAAGGRPPVAAAAAGGMRPKANIPSGVQANAQAGQRAFAMRNAPKAAPATMNPALLKMLIGGAGLGAGYMLGGPVSRAMMPDGSHKLPQPAGAEATDPASRINKKMEEQRTLAQTSAPAE